MFMDWLPFLPPFFGVLAAFLIQRAWSWNEDQSSKKKLLKDIRKELTSCSERLVGQGNLVPTDIWKSAVSSGTLKVIPHDRKSELASIYFKIECHNYEAEKVRDVGILAETTQTEKPKAKREYGKEGEGERLIINIIDRTDAQLLWDELSVRLKKSEEELKKAIDDLLKQDIWG